MHNRIEELKEDLCEIVNEEDLPPEEENDETAHSILSLRNIAAALAAILFLCSLFPLPQTHLMKGVAYFFGAGAYFCEILLLTDCFRQRVPHQELFMVYCFGPMYILLGLSYLFGH